EQERLRLERGNAADVLVAARLVPERQERRKAGHGEVDAARQQRVVQPGGTRNLAERDGDIAEAQGLRVLRDELLRLDDVELQVAEAGLPADADLVRLRIRDGTCERQHDRGRGDNDVKQTAMPFVHGLLLRNSAARLLHRGLRLFEVRIVD